MEDYAVRKPDCTISQLWNNIQGDFWCVVKLNYVELIKKVQWDY